MANQQSLDASESSAQGQIIRQGTSGISDKVLLSSVEIRPPYFHFKLNYDRFIRNEFESRASFEVADLLPDTFCLSTIFAEENSRLLEGCFDRVFKGKEKKKVKDICSTVEAADKVTFNQTLQQATSCLDIAFWECLLKALGKGSSRKPGLYDEDRRQWLPTSKYPTQVTWNAQVERDFCTFLNTLAEYIGHILNLPIRRRFTADHCTTKLVGHVAGRKPDITLFPVGGEPKDTGRMALWRLVQCCLEMKNSNSASATKDAIIQLAGTASIMWATQDNRDFIIGVTRTVKTAENQHQFNIVKMDKSGISQSSQYDCGKDATMLIRLVTGLALGDSTCIGFTRSVDLESARVFDYHANESNPIRKLTLQTAHPISNPVGAYLLKSLPKSFSSLQDSSHRTVALPPGALPPDTVIHIDEILHVSQANFGRGTVVWAGHVHHHNNDTSMTPLSSVPSETLMQPPSPVPSETLMQPPSPVPSETPTQPLSLPRSRPPFTSSSSSPANDRSQYIVKDIWHDVNRPYTEGEILQMLEGLDHIPKFKGEFVPDPYRRSSARGLRQFLSDEHYDNLVAEQKVEERIRLRLVYGPPDGVSDPKARLIYRYKNRAELIGALIAIVKAHQEAAKRGIIHRDITISNSYIIDYDDGTTSGFLGDWGFADVQGYLDQGGKSSSQPLGPRGGREQWVRASPNFETHHRTGSAAFLPVEAQFELGPKDAGAPPFVHEAHHDLQSLFLVMLTLFTVFGRDQTYNEETTTAMRSFYSPSDWKEAAQWKYAFLCGSQASFVGEVSNHIDPYWDCLWEPFKDLWQEVFSGITLHPTNKEDLPLFKPKSHGRAQLLDDRKQRAEARKRWHSDDRGKRRSEGAGGYLKNDLPITHDIFLEYLHMMLEIAKSEDEMEEKKKQELQLEAKKAREATEAAMKDLSNARMVLRSTQKALQSMGQPQNALPTESSSTSTGLGNTATDILDDSATIQAQPSSQPWNPFTCVRGESLILENYDDGAPKAPEPVNNYFTPLSCIGVSQAAQFHVPSSDLPSANHAPFVSRAFPFNKKRANSDGDDDFVPANSRVSKRSRSVKSGKTKNASSRGSRKRGSKKGKEKEKSQASSTLLGQLKFEQEFPMDAL